jgi:hypothetical protein
VDVHIKSGNTPTLRLEQDGTSGFTPQTWDVAGNEANFFIRDATNGSTLPFRIKPGAPSNVLYIDNDGEVGFGTTSPAAPIHLLTDSSTDADIRAEKSGGATVEFVAKTDKVTMGSGSTHEVRISSDGTGRVGISATGQVHVGTSNIGTYSHLFEVDNGSTLAYTDGGAWVDGSSRAYKDNIKDLTTADAMKTLKSLNPVRFNYKSNYKEECLGFIAEDVPDLVATQNRKGLAPMEFAAVLTKVVQEQQKMVQGQQKLISQQQQTILQLQKKMADLEKRLDTK